MTQNNQVKNIRESLSASLLVPNEPGFTALDPSSAITGRDFTLPKLPMDEPTVSGISADSIAQLTFERRPRASNYDSDDDQEAKEACKLEDELRAIQADMMQYESMMASGPDDKLAPVPFFKRLMKLGLQHQEPTTRSKWTKLEPTVVALMANQQQCIATLVTNIMPCTLGEICTYIYGINEGTRLHVTERLDAVERNMSDMIDSLKVIFVRLETSYKDHVAQTKQFADQVNNASKSLATGVSSFEKLLVQVSENLLKMPLVVPAPSVCSAETGLSVHKPPKKPSIVPSKPSLLDPIPIEKEGISVNEIVEDGLYTGSYMSFRIIKGEARDITITVRTMKFLQALEKSRAKVLSCILCAPPTVLSNMERVSPGWLKRMMTMTAQEKIDYIGKHFQSYRRNPVFWTFFPATKE